MDKRPKRRRHKDNPYTLICNKDLNIYFVSFKDSREKFITIQISEEVFNAFNEFELRDLSELNEFDNHIEHSELYENTLNKRISNFGESLDDYIIRKSTYEDLMRAINELPDLQKRRIKKYYFNDYSMVDIAEQEGCSKVAVKYSLECAIENLKKILKN